MLWLYLFIFFLPADAFAYLDPGTGAALVNLLVAGVATLIYSLKGFVFSLFKPGKKPQKAAQRGMSLAILSEGTQYYATFEPIIRNLIQEEIEFSYWTLDVEDPALRIDSEYMHSRFLGYGAWAFSRAGNINADYLLCTTPNIGCKGYPIRKSPLVKNLVHVFHSINDLSMYRRGSLDYYDMVIMVGDFQAASIREIEKKRHLKEKRLVTLGIPYLDVYSKGKDTESSNIKVKTILIGSSWGSKGLLSHYGTDFIRLLAGKGYQLILRPHPQSLVSEQAMLEKCKADLQQYKNVIWNTETSPQQAMNQADILISDTSSLRFDFAFVYEKPVITLEIPSAAMPGYERDDLASIWSDSAEKEIGFCLAEKDLNQLPDFVEKAMQEYDPDRIRKFRDSTLANYADCGKAITGFFALELKSKEGGDA